MLSFGVIFLWSVFAVSGQQVRMPDDGKPIVSTLCELAERPELYAGRMVTVRASFMGKNSGKNTLRQFWIEDFENDEKKCSAYLSVVVVSPEEVEPHPGFDLTRDNALQSFLENIRKGKRVAAAFTGRFDVAYVWREHKRIRVGQTRGFGTRGKYDGRIVLRQISDVVAHSMPSK